MVDGIPINSDTWNISPDDIESYTVLKGPVASALYGYRGQNGAIIINTKKGTKDKRGYSVEFNSSTMVNKGFIALPKTQDLYGPGDHGQYKFVDGKGAGINDNDLAIIESAQAAKNGDIVVALIDDSATIKRFFKEKDHIRLQPENDAMEPIIVDDCKILGKLVGIFRSII